ncbi:MAG: alpha-hydroxy acid oxidase [Jatrophihabitans sp.]
MLPALSHVRTQARDRLPAVVWDWIEATAGADAHDAAKAWDGFRIRPRILRDVSTIELAVELLGRRSPLPILVAPTGYQTFVHPDGELAVARAACQFGSPLIVSMRSTTRFERIAEVADEWWLQVYAMRDPALTDHLVRRAVQCGARALVFTADTPYLGAQRSAGALLNIGDAHRVNIDDYVDIGAGATQQDPTCTFDVIGRLRALSGLPVLVKGVLRGDDARACLASGAAGVIVSNHGLRQLSRVISTAAALPEVVAAVGTDGEVYVDGGIRDGTSALIGLALGARAVLVGRPVLWGLAADGAAGVTAVLAALRADLAEAMGLAGMRRVVDLAPDLITTA